MLHFVGEGGNNIKNCRNIPQRYKIFYGKVYALRQEQNKQNKKKVARAAMIDNAIEVDNTKMSSAYQLSRKRSKITVESTPVATPMQPQFSGSKTLQLKLTDRDENLESRLTTSIADFIFSRGLPFRIAEHPKFQKMLQLENC